MANCKVDFLEEVEGRDVLCAEIEYGDMWYSVECRKCAKLSIGFSPNEYTLFLEAINYEYDSGYGGQEVFGTIWYKDGTWSERGEYDGSEWWEHKARPDIPAELRQEDGQIKSTL